MSVKKRICEVVEKHSQESLQSSNPNCSLNTVSNRQTASASHLEYKEGIVDDGLSCKKLAHRSLNNMTKEGKLSKVALLHNKLQPDEGSFNMAQQSWGSQQSLSTTSVTDETSKHDPCITNSVNGLKSVNTGDNTKEIDVMHHQAAEHEDEGIKLLDSYRKRLEENDQTVFLEMFELLITKMANIEKSMMSVQQKQLEVSEKVQQLENSLDYFGQTVDEIGQDFDEIESINMKLTEAVIKCEEEVIKVGANINQLSTTSHKGKFLVFGLDDEDSVDAKESVKKFIKQKLGIDDKHNITVTSAHKIGKKPATPIWFKILDPDHVALIFNNVSNLKGKKNTARKNFHIQQYLSERDNAEHVHQQDLVMQNCWLPISHQVSMKRCNNKIVINNEVFESASILKTPKTKATLLTPDEDLDIEKTAIHKGQLTTINGSSFYAYAATVHSLDEVKASYKIVKAQHISASHIMCSYKIFGSKFYELQNYSDDGKHAGGKVILNCLKDMKVWNLAVFVVRYHEGPNLS